MANKIIVYKNKSKINHNVHYKFKKEDSNITKNLLTDSIDWSTIEFISQNLDALYSDDIFQKVTYH
mgnify:CR=1 FL=1